MTTVEPEQSRQPPFDQLRQKIKNQIHVTPDGLEWKWVQRTGEFVPSFHTPLAQLWMMYKNGFEPNDITFDLDQFHIVKKENDDFGYSKKAALGDSESIVCNLPQADMGSTSYGGLIKSFLEPLNEEPQKLQEIKDIFQNSHTMHVLGCINPASAFGLLHELNKLKFKGNCYIFDKSSVPVYLISMCSRIGQWERRFGINLYTKKDNIAHLTELFPSIPSADIVLSDITGNYLTEDEFLKAMMRVAYNGKQKTYLLSRDIGGYEDVSAANRTVTSSTSSIGIEKQEEFRQWLNNQWGYSVSEEAIGNVITHLFPSSQHEPRGYPLPYWRRRMMEMEDEAVQTKLLFSFSYESAQNMTPPSTTPKRVFSTMLWRLDMSPYSHPELSSPIYVKKDERW